jgi:G3E family GTPase
LLPVAGRYVLFTQHLPHKLNLTLTGPVLIGEHHFAPEQAHEGAVDCVRLTVEKPLHAARFQHWLERLLRGHGGDLIRLQGSLNFAGSTNQIVIQGVCQSIDTRVLEPWGDRPRATRLVLIGRRLAKRELYWRLQACGTGLSSHPCIDSRVL